MCGVSVNCTRDHGVSAQILLLEFPPAARQDSAYGFYVRRKLDKLGESGEAVTLVPRDELCEKWPTPEGTVSSSISYEHEQAHISNGREL